jgi:cytoskeletal protein RodZ
MKSNSLLTYVLYGLLGLFILAAGYYACQKQKEQKEQAAREAAELEETLRDMGYASEDTTAASGSTYTSKDTLAKPSSTTTTKPGAKTNGVQNWDRRTKPHLPRTPSPQPRPATTTKPSSTITKPKTTGTTKGASAVKGPGTGRWAVRAGTFTYKEGARRRLEEVIRAGYPNAEISKTKEGLEAVIVYRSNNKNAAIQVVDKLELKGIDAAVFDRNK